MPKVDRADRWRPSAAFGLCVSGVVLGFLLGGFPGAFGAFIVAVGIMTVRRSRSRQASIPRTACEFAIWGQDDQSIAGMLFRTADDATADDTAALAEHLREHGWGILEPPLDGPQAPIRGIGVEFVGDRSLVVQDVRGRGVRAALIADRLSDLPSGWARAAEDAGYVLLVLDDGAVIPGAMPVVGAYALLRGTRLPS